MFTVGLVIADSSLRHLRGQDNLSSFGQSRSIGTRNQMTNYFCKTCGTLMYRVGTAFPGLSLLRLGTVDDFNLHETKLKPKVEQFVKDRVAWISGAEGVKQVEGYHYV
jgi:hypothetical protein